jgi:ribonuclease R
MGRKNAKKKKKQHGSADTLQGKLDVTRSGIGFVAIGKERQDILVRPADFNTALHGDTVRVEIVNDGKRSNRQRGIITDVVERKQTDFIGHLEISESFAFFIAETDKPMPDVYVALHLLNGATNKDKVVVRITQWEKNKKPSGEVVQVMDVTNEHDFAMKEILIENGFAVTFPDEVIEESQRLPDVISQDEIARRKDCRDILTVTIDPIDAKDFDDAISFRELKNDVFEIGVHIADVSHYVEPETELDKEAYERATSVYLPDRVNPMLPERISNELCSLRPHEDKLTFSAIFQITSKAEVKHYWIGKTVIHSDHRFTYEEVQEIIEKKEGLHSEVILTLNEIAQRFRRQRFKKGAINFSSQEVRFKLDENANPIGIIIKESKEAHQLIEEFMLLANRIVAENVGKIKVEKQEVPFPYRVHDTPDEEKLAPFVEFAKKFGHKFDTKSPEAIASSFNLLLADAHGKPEQHVLEQLGIRTMAKAVYTTENIGHYGLGFKHYCHFTSPIRRYPDILVHRILEQCLNKQIKFDKKLEAKSKHCSERERAAMDSERAGNKYKQVQYMQQFLGEEFAGVISGVAAFGFWVETVEHKCEGLVSINTLLEYDDFRHVETDYALVGRRTGRAFRMGDKVYVKVVSTNLAKRQIDYEWVITSAIKDNGQPTVAEADGSVPKPKKKKRKDESKEPKNKKPRDKRTKNKEN